ncbi:hypothetical protein AX14_003274 [Amanita brunnescens Koide BX004]|nr:hypothetical protein AX14_003274 [Amanita brunnescens Koide BX004]
MLRNSLLPLLLFPTISALASTYIFRHVHESGLGNALGGLCSPQSDLLENPYRMSYMTGIDALDKALCSLVTFFQFAIQPDEDEPLPRLFASYLLGNLLPLLAIIAVEMQRYRLSARRAGRWIGNPLLSSFFLLGTIYQNITIAITIPIYFTMAILSGSTPGQKDMLTKQHVEAIMFGLVMGYLIPSVGMLVLNDPHVTAIWQFFPLIVSMFKHMHLAVRRPSRDDARNAHGAVRMLYLTLGIVASSMHAALVWPKIASLDIDSLKLLFVPARLYGYSWATTAGQTMELLQWDGVLCFIATMFWTFWVVPGRWREVKVTAWYIVAVPLIGPGAAVAGVGLWRETS